MTIVPRPHQAKELLHKVLPEIALWWDESNEHPLEVFSSRSTIPVKLICPMGHRFKNKPMNLTGYKKTPIYCRECNSLRCRFPELSQELVDPDDGTLSWGSHTPVEWRCPDESHTYLLKINKRTGRGDGCPYCSNHQVLVGFNDLRTRNPEVASLLVDQLIPETVTEFSGKSHKFMCSEGHTWASSINNVSSGRRCRKCSKQGTSLVEKELRRQVGEYLNLVDTHPVTLNMGGRKISIDILVEYNNRLVAIEYDGAYWHRDSVVEDLSKTTHLIDNNIPVIRVREQFKNKPLPFLPSDSENILQIKRWYVPFNPEGSLGDIVPEIIVPWIQGKVW